MRLRHPDGQLVHLGYCTNVHPAEDLAGILAQLDTYAAAVRRHLDGEVVGLGLWLPARLAAALADAPAARRRLRRHLDAHGLEVVTLSGSPYPSPGTTEGAGADRSTKYAAYQPNWTSRERLEYTLNLARILADLLPGDAVRGSVSTLPLAWREPWDAAAAAEAGRVLDELAEGLTEVAWRTGRLIQVGFEPEPGCVVETTEQAVSALRRVNTDRIGLCLDLAHLACAWEDPVQALTRLEEEGLPVVKVQVSAALEVADPAAAQETLRGLAGPGLLRQTRTASGLGTDDVEEALAEDLPGPWRVRCHVPAHAEPAPPLATTVPVLRDALDALLGGQTAVCDHLEVETHTWDVLASPPRNPDQLAAGIAAELAFVRDELRGLGLVPARSRIHI
ncbi:MAG: metabolite traffic protein EboE [Micromonosporaceae bacterium]|nr:metabolite traffic protein EboE [Micromonosporaceae bacterium]